MPEFQGKTGKIHYRSWVPESPEVLMVFFHGLGEHVGSYHPFAAALNEAGIALWAHDHAGHGRSEGVRVLIERVDDLLDDAVTSLELARAEYPDVPLVVAGHSLGASVATLLAGERRVPASALVLAGSTLLPSGPSGLAALLAGGIDPMDLRKDPGEMTRDPAYARQIRADPLTWQGGLRLETVQAWGGAAARVSDVVRSGALRMPILLVHGEKDDMAPAAGAVEAARLLPDARTAIFPDDLHNILNEIDRADVYCAVIDFVRREIG
ncbi:MAG: alpha/beta fold hydrolase [Kibdelosporangium sp.]